MQQLYQNWLKFVFDRPETTNGWYFDVDFEPFESEGHPEAITELVIKTCTQSGHDLASFTDGQVAAGLNYIFNNSCSNVVFDLKSPSLSLETRIKCIQSIEALYQECFSKRCIDALSHLNKGLSNPLNGSCYMLWDVTPLMYWEEDPNKMLLYSSVVSLLKRCLSIPHIACIESALHGLGHVHPFAPEEVESTIDEWLKCSNTSQPKLLQYASAAKAGHVL